MRSLAAAWLLLAPAGPAARAQQRAPARPAWYVTASVGLVGRETRTWKPTHLALAPTGWDGRFPNGCVIYCPTSADVAEGRPPALSVAVRRQLRRRWQLRLFAGHASPGYYPGSEAISLHDLTVRPSTDMVGAQGVYGYKSVWLGAGPTGYRSRLTITAGPSTRTDRRSGLGFDLAAGLTVPRSSRFFLDLVVERRFAGSITTPVLPVAGAPDLPSLTVPLSATVLSAGFGWRR